MSKGKWEKKFEAMSALRDEAIIQLNNAEVRVDDRQRVIDEQRGVLTELRTRLRTEERLVDLTENERDEARIKVKAIADAFRAWTEPSCYRPEDMVAIRRRNREAERSRDMAPVTHARPDEDGAL